MNEKRIDYLDYGKAFAIFVIVLVHSGLSEFNNHLTLFTIPLFFIVIGYVYVPDKRTIKYIAARKFKELLLPFWGFMLLYIIVELVRAPYFGYADAKYAIPAFINMLYGSGWIPNNSGVFNNVRDVTIDLGRSGTSVDLITATNAHLWFLPALFTAFVIFCFIMEKTKRKHLNDAIIIVCLLLLASMEVIFPQIKQLPYGLGRGFLGAAFMLAGFWMKQYKIFDRKITFSALAASISLFFAAVSVILGSTGSALVVSYYGEYGVFSIFMTFVGGVGAACFVLYLCKLIYILPLPKIKKVLSLVGTSTMVIYGWHMLLRFVFDVAYFKIFNVPICPDPFYMAVLPPNVWWYMILETVAIIFICILMRKLKTKIKQRFNCKIRAL